MDESKPGSANPADSPSLADLLDRVRWDDPGSREISPLERTETFFDNFPWDGEEGEEGEE